MTGDRGAATVLLLVAVLLAGATALAAGRAGAIAADRVRAATVAEIVAAGVATDRVRGLDAATAITRGRRLARLAGATATRLVEVDDRIEVRVDRRGEVGVARARLEW
ncbi:MAG: hypothetical protein ACKO72_06370 [Actinomycetes bacterium]